MSQSIYVMWIDCGIELFILRMYLVVTVVLCSGPYITFFARGGNHEENFLTFFEIVESVAV